MIDTHSIDVYAPQIAEVKDPAGGYFTVAHLGEFSKESLDATSKYSRKDFYKISLITGDASYFYQGMEYRNKKDEWSLVFTNCEVPYRWEVHDGACNGYACMFTEDFMPLHTFLRPADLIVFKNEGQSVFKLNEKEVIQFKVIFEKMFEEQSSSYINKYDLLFLYVLECIHAALKLQPNIQNRSQSAASQLVESFKRLLASQFPIVYPNNIMTLRSPKQFSDKLAVHTNSLNRAIKEVTGKTTTQLINERIIQEARALLAHSNLSISEISLSLGFEEPTHFTRTFRTLTGQTPTLFRSLIDNGRF